MLCQKAVSMAARGKLVSIFWKNGRELIAASKTAKNTIKKGYCPAFSCLIVPTFYVFFV